MATWTPQSKQPLTWLGESPEVSNEAYELEIADGFFLDIGGGFKITIQPANADINWETTGKQSLSFPAQVTSSIQKLDIGGGFQLDIGDGYELVAGTSERNETNWTTTGKTGR